VVLVIIIYIFSESLCLLGEELVMVSHPGVQRDILLQLELSGPSALMYPTKLFHHCIAVGLKPVYMDAITTFNCSLVSYIELEQWCSLETNKEPKMKPIKLLEPQICFLRMAYTVN
jgi:hypothetical protein